MGDFKDEAQQNQGENSTFNFQADCPSPDSSLGKALLRELLKPVLYRDLQENRSHGEGESPGHHVTGHCSGGALAVSV